MLERIRNRLNEIRVLWRHYSSWAFWAIGVIETARANGVDMTWVPPKVTIALAILGLAAKMYKQDPPKVQP